MAKRPLDRDEDGLLVLGARELFASLAILKGLADAVNISLQHAIPAEQWARMAVPEYANDAKPGNPQQTTRRLSGFVTHKYGALALPWNVVHDAATLQGLKLA